MSAVDRNGHKESLCRAGLSHSRWHLGILRQAQFVLSHVSGRLYLRWRSFSPFCRTKLLWHIHVYTGSILYECTLLNFSQGQTKSLRSIVISCYNLKNSMRFSPRSDIFTLKVTSEKSPLYHLKMMLECSVSKVPTCILHTLMRPIFFIPAWIC